MYPVSHPARIFVPLMARENTPILRCKISPVCVQLRPSSVERKTPPFVPAQRRLPLTARAYTARADPPAPSIAPSFVQLRPWSDETRSPLVVPAKIFAPLTT